MYTTKLYDRTNDAISLDEIERILIQRGIAVSVGSTWLLDGLNIRSPGSL
jgi:hypothetical protein